MITILSSLNDHSTSDIIDWLIHYRKTFKRLNSDGHDRISDLSLRIGSDNVSISTNTNQNLNDIDCSFWFRRGSLVLDNWPDVDFINEEVSNRIKHFIQDEKTVLISYLDYLIKKRSKYLLNSTSDYFLNKITSLDTAFEIGINIPETIITTRREDVVKFWDEFKESGIITKPLSNDLSLKIDNVLLNMYVTELKCETINLLPSRFIPTLFQQKIVKLFEIRAFYLENEFYSMAIFSQDSVKTADDYRNYDYENPNRTVPFLLDEEMQNKLRSLMLKLKLNSGSIDLIYGIDKEIYFLEVNPVGQFSMISIPCNYYLERKIAKALSKHYDEEKIS